MFSAPPRPAAPWLMLVSRSLLFLFFQFLIAVLFYISGHENSWDESARWWPLFAFLANLGSIYLLVRLFRAEGGRYLDLFRFSRTTLKGDLLWLLGASLIGLPIAAAPMNTLAAFIFGDPMTPIHMMFRPLPLWAFIIELPVPCDDRIRGAAHLFWLLHAAHHCSN